MKNSQKGFVTSLLLVIIALVVFGGGVYLYKNKKTKEPVPKDDNGAQPSVQTQPPVSSSEKPMPISTTKPVARVKPGISKIPKNIPKAHNAFGFDLIKSIKNDESSNIFISPSSIALALSMVYNGANGETKNAMQKTLHMQGYDISTINQESLGLINLLKNPDPKVTLAIANSVWARKNVNFSQNFIETLQSYYNAESTVLDFANPNTVKTINSWVSKNTHGKIPTIVTTVPSNMVMYLINAVYFKGSWTKAFDKKLTQNRPFTIADGSSKSTPLMRRSVGLPYLETEDFQSIDLPYGDNGRISMYVFLPKKNVDNFVSSLTPEKWNGWMSQFKIKSGDILLPKFKMDYEKELKETLAGLGMSVAFSDSADLSGIGKDLKVSEVKHKSFVDVNEEGTEAAAITSVGIGVTSVAPPQDTFYMEVNHPFFFAIRDNQTEEVLFMGVVQNP